jgi:hypothetical protein
VVNVLDALLAEFNVRDESRHLKSPCCG